MNTALAYFAAGVLTGMMIAVAFAIHRINQALRSWR